MDYLDKDGLTHLAEKLQTQIAGKADANHTHTPASIGAATSSHNHSASQITSGTLPVARGGTGVASLTGTDYTTSRVRGIALQSSVPTSIPNGCIVGVYEVT